MTNLEDLEQSAKLTVEFEQTCQAGDIKDD